MTPPPNAGFDLSIVIPCYNEGESLGQLESALLPIIAELRRRARVELILVDDGSRDDTPQRLARLAAHDRDTVVVTHAYNRGIGAALRSGIAVARGAWIVTTDADGTYRFDEIPALLAMRAPTVDIVTASPYHPRGGVMNVPAYRLVLSRGASVLYRLIVGGQVHTYTALFRAYRREVLEQVPVRSDGFLAVAQLLAEALLSGYSVAEYATVLHVRRYGQSKARVARITGAHLRYMASLLITRLIAPRPRADRKAL
ncbi:glycosyltransferase family 2 protein [Kallotenue papyrolyticum]|uniref:glycosyltransferase family 2 protein n=1 Tax=Kallotenue papyrolyticum TaxID=1325125 RepID=UPI00047853FE|nr:glycosyltransferase family 2 protein [Kallotenue papyrolyticum]